MISKSGWLQRAELKALISARLTADLPAIIGAGLDNYLQAGHHQDMSWMAETRNRRTTPTAMWDAARTAVIFGCNYGPDHDPMDNLAAKSSANISVYARGRDYHDVLKGRLKQLAGRLAANRLAGQNFLWTLPR